jgi:hypothetical protein
MKGRLVSLAGSLLGVLLLSSAVGAGSEPLRLTILFTNDVQGYIEPCG